jgi:hypothetical protein
MPSNVTFVDTMKNTVYYIAKTGLKKGQPIGNSHHSQRQPASVVVANMKCS